MMPPPKPRGGFVRGIFVTLATTIFGLSLTLNVYLLLTSGFLSGGSSRETNLVEGDYKQKIAVVPINGIIMDEMANRVERWMRTIEKDADIKAIVLEIDSPGGSVTASDAIWHRIHEYKIAHPNTPVLVSMTGLAASGGYYVSCAADELYAQPSSLTGNIGVLLPQYNLSKLFDKWGIEENTIVSSGATFKNAGSMFKAEKPEDRAYLQDIADKAFAQFKDVVATGRGTKLTKPLKEIANGKIYVAADAKTLGLIDDIKYPEEVYDIAAKKAGLTKKMVVKYRDPPSFFDALSGQSNVSGAHASAGSSVTINGINVNANDLRDLMIPRLMYLWRGQ